METLIVLGLIADAIGVAGGVFAAFAWYQARKLRQETKEEKRRLDQRVQVVLKLVEAERERQITLPIELRRAELTRAELLGCLGMVPMKDKGRRFSLAFLSEPVFMKELNRIQQADGENVLIIPCSEDEINQFDVPHERL